MQRRTLLKSSVWAIPAVTIATTAPAFAATSDVSTCTVTGFKKPGNGKNTKDYYLRTDCGNRTVVSVYSKRLKEFKKSGGMWVSKGNKSSASNLPVVLTFSDGTSETFSVQFPPA